MNPEVAALLVRRAVTTVTALFGGLWLGPHRVPKSNQRKNPR
jgi:hypothetical protein